MSESIVVGTDGSDSATRAVAEAARLAKALEAELHVVSAFKPLRGARVGGAAEGTAEEWQPLPHSKVESALGEAAALVRIQQVPVTTHAVERDPADALLDVAGEVSANLIVVGSKGMHGARRLTLGNVPNQVSHRARCNVLVVATEEPGADEAAATAS